MPLVICLNKERDKASKIEAKDPRSSGDKERYFDLLFRNRSYVLDL